MEGAEGEKFEVMAQERLWNIDKWGMFEDRRVMPSDDGD